MAHEYTAKIVSKMSGLGVIDSTDVNYDPDNLNTSNLGDKSVGAALKNIESRLENLNFEGGGGSNKIEGIISLTSDTNIKSILKLSTEVNKIRYYLIGDENGKLPSLTKCYNIPSNVIKVLNTTTTNTATQAIIDLAISSKTFEPIGVNVGDLIAFTLVNVSVSDLATSLGVSLSLPGSIQMYLYKILATNDAKAPNGDFKGVMGLMSPGDKYRVGKIDNIELTSNNNRDRLNALIPTIWKDNMNECLETGIYPWCSLGRPAGSTSHYTCITIKSTTPDSSGYYTYWQTCFGREDGGDAGKIYQRVFFLGGAGKENWGEGWKRVDGGGSTESTNTKIENFDSFSIEKEDNSGNSVWVLISEITDLLTKDSGGDTYGFTGMYNAHRDAGHSNEETGFIVARAFYEKEKWTLKTTGSYVTPYVVKYDPNWNAETATEEPTKYWIALELTGSRKNIDFIGDSKNLNSFIYLNSDSQSSPENVFIVGRPTTYKMPGIGANVQAVETGLTYDNIDSNTYLKYTDQPLTDDLKTTSRNNIGLTSLYDWYTDILPRVNNITGYLKHLIGAGAYLYKTKPNGNKILPNTFYDFGDVSGAFIVYLDTPSDTEITNEYMFLFKATTENTSLSVTATAWSKPLEIKANKTYQVSILNGLATFLEF